MTAIALEKIVRRHGTTRVLDQVSFEVESGEMVVLLGPSGCGKSTLLRLISGLDRPDAGLVHLAGRDMTHSDPAERMVSMVFQSYGLFPHLSVRDNILFGLKVRRFSQADRDRRLARAVEVLGLGALLARRPGQLSGGQQQRVALARALVSERPIWLMDEPLSNLDVQLRAALRREIGELQRSLRLTMIYVTHDQTEAMTLADRIVLLDQGRVQQIGSPQALYDEPANLFAAAFVGAPPMNCLALTADAMLADPQRFRAALPKAAEILGARGAVTLGVRPGDFALDAAAGLPARVTASEYLGGGHLVTCRFLGRDILLLVDADPPCAGDTIGLRAKAGAEHLFDPTTTLRIR